jgi:hypothetical protein
MREGETDGAKVGGRDGCALPPDDEALNLNAHSNISTTEEDAALWLPRTPLSASLHADQW